LVLRRDFEGSTTPATTQGCMRRMAGLGMMMATGGGVV
jgi:hypothetical protein